MMFSILVPVYNVEKYVAQCIESIISQTFWDYELILVDDGSTDSSAIICDAYQNKYPGEIRVIHQENKGSLLARRAAISYAKGDYFVFVDSDDYIRLDALEVIHRAIVRTQADLILYNYTRIDHAGNANAHHTILQDNKIFSEKNKQEIYDRLLFGSSLNNICLKAVDSKLMDIENDYLDARHVFWAEDLLQTLPIVTKAERILYINEHLYFYRHNKESLTNSFNLGWFDSVHYVYMELAKYIKIWKLDDEYRMVLFKQKYINMMIGAIKQISLPSCNLTIEKKRAYLKKLAEDPYFIEVYDYSDHKLIDIKWRYIIMLLRKGRFSPLIYFSDLRRMLIILKWKFL